MSNENISNDLSNISDNNVVRVIKNRYEYAKNSHNKYIGLANRNERFFLGDGGQWDEEVIKELCEQDKKAIELNVILPTVLSLLGYAVNNRMDVVAYPVGEQDQKISEIVTKLIRSILQNNDYQWTENEVMLDGFVMKRGYLDIRMDFTENVFGDIKIIAIDPRDVIPDSSANDSNPDNWGWVITRRWLTIEEIKSYYGEDKVKKILSYGNTQTFEDVDRSKLGDVYGENYFNDRFMILEQQHFEWKKQKCVVGINGDARRLMDYEEKDANRLSKILESGQKIIERKIRVVKWEIICGDVVLHNEISPYNHYTIVPFFPMFRRGKTLSPVDNLISPQELENKMASQMLHNVNTITNQGWIVEENSITNMTTDQLNKSGSKPKVVVEFRAGTQKPERITSGTMPQGYETLLNIANKAIGQISSIDDTSRLANAPDTSGVAIQSRQHYSWQTQGYYIESIGKMRKLLAKRIVELIQGYYDSHRMFRITETDTTGKQVSNNYVINKPTESGEYLNDLSLMKYDVEVSTQPTQQTFQNNQFTQTLEMLKQGVPIPPHIVIKYSALTDKAEIIGGMKTEKPDPVVDATVRLKNAQAGLAEATRVTKEVESIYSATTAAEKAAILPQIAPVSDNILASAGFIDKNGGGVVNTANLQSVPTNIPQDAVKNNNNPLTPLNPQRGMESGIEGGKV